MPNPRDLSEDEIQALWTEVRAEFPHDEMLQEVHFIRLLHNAQLKHLSRDERMEHFNRLIPRSPRMKSQ